MSECFSPLLLTSNSFTFGASSRPNHFQLGDSPALPRVERKTSTPFRTKALSGMELIELPLMSRWARFLKPTKSDATSSVRLLSIKRIDLLEVGQLASVPRSSTEIVTSWPAAPPGGALSGGLLPGLV